MGRGAAARANECGLQILTLPQLAARLAGGFTAPLAMEALDLAGKRTRMRSVTYGCVPHGTRRRPCSVRCRPTCCGSSRAARTKKTRLLRTDGSQAFSNERWLFPAATSP